MFSSYIHCGCTSFSRQFIIHLHVFVLLMIIVCSAYFKTISLFVSDMLVSLGYSAFVKVNYPSYQFSWTKTTVWSCFGGKMCTGIMSVKLAIPQQQEMVIGRRAASIGDTSRKLRLIKLCWKVAETGQNCKVAQNLLFWISITVGWRTEFLGPVLSFYWLFSVGKLTVCSAGIWQLHWPWRCCLLVRCGPWSLCPRGTVRHEHFLLTEEEEPLYSEGKDEQRRCLLYCCTGNNCNVSSTRGKRRPSLNLPTCWRNTVNGYMWTFDPRGKVQNLDIQCCSKMCFLSEREKKTHSLTFNETRPTVLKENRSHEDSPPHLHPSPEILKDGGDDCVLFSLLDLLPGRPDITEEHFLPLRCHTFSNNKKHNVIMKQLFPSTSAQSDFLKL